MGERTRFDLPVPALPPGFRLRPDLLSAGEERELLEGIERLTFRTVVMRGQEARRTVSAFGHEYAFGSRRVRPGAPIPGFLLPVRQRLAELGGIPAESLVQGLVARYPPGAGIGWHRDAPAFGPTVVGLSLRAPCTMSVRPAAPGSDGADVPSAIVRVPLAPRSAYVIGEPARSRWLHRVAPVRELRYAVTFRTLRDDVRHVGSA